jgi:hypothetical protein
VAVAQVGHFLRVHKVVGLVVGEVLVVLVVQPVMEIRQVSLLLKEITGEPFIYRLLLGVVEVAAVLQRLVQPQQVLLTALVQEAMERPHLFLGRLSLMLVVVAGVVTGLHQILLAGRVVLVVEGVGPVLHPVLKMELLTLEAVAVEEVVVFLEPVTAALESFSSNTSPNLITKSSNHQAHGLHLLALLRSST